MKSDRKARASPQPSGIASSRKPTQNENTEQ
jgi:hypothetical protein